MRLFQFRPRKLFAGTWEDRLSDLFDCGVDYAGRRILDVGCNMGVVAYEISKRRPASVHGIDTYRPALRLARQLFLAVEVDARLDRLDLTSERRAQAILAPQYDVILFLSVYHHIKKQSGVAAAEAAVRRLTARCREALIARLPPGFDSEFISLMAGQGFSVSYDGERKGRSGRLVVFRPAEGLAGTVQSSAGDAGPGMRE